MRAYSVAVHHHLQGVQQLVMVHLLNLTLPLSSTSSEMNFFMKVKALLSCGLGDEEDDGDGEHGSASSHKIFYGC